MCNIGSVVRVLNDLKYEYEIVNNPKQFSDTKKIILPGVGSFDSFINSLKSKNLFEEIKKTGIKKKVLNTRYLCWNAVTFLGK